MTAAGPVAWPGSRILLAWWRELARWHPLQMEVAHFPLQRLEALVRLAQCQPLDPLQHALLRLLAHHTPADIPARLNLDAQLFTRMLQALLVRGLAEEAPAGVRLTTAGQEALAEGCYTVHSLQRQPFYFLDPAGPEQSPAFLALQQPLCTVRTDPPSQAINTSLLQACIERDRSWKVRHQFPSNVEAVLAAPPGSLKAADWRQVVLVSAEQAWMVLVRMVDENERSRLIGFNVRGEGWVLQADRPALALGDAWPEVLPELAKAPSLEAWRQAWHLWCQPRGIPAAEAAACRLERSGPELIVHAPHRLIDRLRAARSDAVKGEAWLLAGTARIRAAARIQLADDVSR